ncbi:MAG: hypothetical protein OJJ54_04945 [Pseudonocardia sp.]|nr:hypothetical protein [Pseudonocardia sp.]
MHARLDAPVGTLVQVGTVAVPLRPRRPRPAELPPRPARFVGREREAAVVTRVAARAGRVRSVLLAGRPGSGKTALAVECAHRGVGLFPDGVVFAELGLVDGRGPSVHELAGRLLRSLGARVPDGTGDRASAWRRLLRERRVLVVLDDVQGAAQVAGLLPVAGDRAFAVLTGGSGLTTLTATLLRLRLGDLDPESSRACLGHGRAPDPALDELARLCAGLPLALRIVAARLAAEPGLTPAGLAAQLRRRHRTIDELRAGDRAVRVSFEAAHAGLGDAERRLFRRLTAVPLRDVTVPGAAALAALPAGPTAELLARLHDAQLLDRLPERVPRYRLHDLLRRFGEEKLRAHGPGEAAVARERLLGYYRAALGPGGSAPDPAWFAAEGDNLVALAGHLAQAAAPDARAFLQQLADAVAPGPGAHPAHDAWMRIHEIALAAAGADGRSDRRTELQVRMGDGLRDRGDLDAAAECYREAIVALRGLGPDRAVVEALARALHGLGDVECLRGRPWLALGRQRAALRRFTELGSPSGRARAWQGIGDARRGAGDRDGADDAYHAALDLFAEVGDVAAAARTLQRLGELSAAGGRHRSAAAQFELARAAAVLGADAPAEARARRWLAVTAAAGAQVRPSRSPAGP